MELKRKLVYLHIVFAVFSISAAIASIYAIHLHVGTALDRLELLVDQSNVVDRLAIETREQRLALRAMVYDKSSAPEDYTVRRHAFFDRISQVTEYIIDEHDADLSVTIKTLEQQIRQRFSDAQNLSAPSMHLDARLLISDGHLDKLFDDLQMALKRVASRLDSSRHDAVNRIVATDARVFSLAAGIVISCICFVTASAYLIRRWLVAPVQTLVSGTKILGKGNLDHRIKLSSQDELGTLAASLNSMAGSLKISQDKYRSLFENQRDAAIICNQDGIIIECHDGDPVILNVFPTATVGQPLASVWAKFGLKLETWQDMYERALMGETVSQLDVEISQSTGRKAVADVLAYPVQYGGEDHVAIVIRDATERHQLQRLSKRSETMDATETFARGIAHDFKNLLNNAVGALSLIRHNGDDDRQQRHIQSAISACRQAARLSTRLLDFSCIDKGHEELIDVSELVGVVLESVQDAAPSKIEVTSTWGDSIVTTIDRDHITQVVLNLFQNAMDAMPDGGSLHVETGITMASNPVGSQPPARYSFLSVEDTGVGMPDDVKARLFEPLFTTKPSGPEGTRGLGLAVVYMIVRNCGGFIQVRSEVGRGSTIRVLLPHSPIIDKSRSSTTQAKNQPHHA